MSEPTLPPTEPQHDLATALERIRQIELRQPPPAATDHATEQPQAAEHLIPEDDLPVLDEVFEGDDSNLAAIEQDIAVAGNARLNAQQIENVLEQMQPYLAEQAKEAVFIELKNIRRILNKELENQLLAALRKRLESDTEY